MDALVQFLTARYDEEARRLENGYYGDTHWERFTTDAHLGAWQAWRQHFPRAQWDVKGNDLVSEAAVAAVRERVTAHEADRAKRTLADIAMHRKLLTEFLPLLEGTDERIAGEWNGHDDQAGQLLDYLAEPYRDHPDFPEEHCR